MLNDNAGDFMNLPLTEEQRMFQDSLRGFLEKEIYPHEAACDRTGVVPEELGEHLKQRAIEMGITLTPIRKTR